MDSVRARQLYVSTNPKDLPGANFAPVRLNGAITRCIGRRRKLASPVMMLVKG